MRLTLAQRILVTHGHHDHYAGAYDVVQLLTQETGSTPMVYKRVMDRLQTDRNRIDEHPEILACLYNTREGDTFSQDGAAITVVETPGHIDDHLCFLLKEPGEPTYLFTGDHIIGADSVRLSNSLLADLLH